MTNLDLLHSLALTMRALQRRVNRLPQRDAEPNTVHVDGVFTATVIADADRDFHVTFLHPRCIGSVRVTNAGMLDDFHLQAVSKARVDQKFVERWQALLLAAQPDQMHLTVAELVLSYRELMTQPLRKSHPV